MEVPIKKLNDAGVELFREALASGRATGIIRAITELRDHPEFHARSFDATVDETHFPSAYGMAEYLTQRLLPLTPEEIEGTSGFGDVGLWSWLSLWFFDTVCPPKNEGTRAVGPDERYIPELRKEFSFHRYYRHRLAGPYRVYRQHGENSFPLLHTPVQTHSGLYTALAEQQDLMQTPSVINAIGLLYFDAAEKRPKPGAAGSARAGSLRRFIEVVRQLDLTYDLRALRGHDLVNLLPEEFRAWRVAIAT